MKQIRENILSFCKKKRRKYLLVQKKALSLHSLSWKQSFYLKETNTYWRFGAVTCEGHRFFYVITFPIIYNVIRIQRTIVQLFTKMKRKRIWSLNDSLFWIIPSTNFHFTSPKNHSISEILNNKTIPASIEENSQRHKMKYIFTNKDLFKKVNLSLS